MQALQQHGGHGGNHCLQLLGRLHGNDTGDAGKENRGEGCILKRLLWSDIFAVVRLAHTCLINSSLQINFTKATVPLLFVSRERFVMAHSNRLFSFHSTR